MTTPGRNIVRNKAVGVCSEHDQRPNDSPATGSSQSCLYVKRRKK